MTDSHDAETEFPPQLRALVVDDHPRNRQIMQALLELLDCAAATVASGEAGVDFAARARFDLIVMDRSLGGGLDGDEATRRIRRRGASRQARILRWTTDPQDRFEAALYDGELCKPVVLHDLGAAVAEVRLCGPRPERKAARSRVSGRAAEGDGVAAEG